MNISLTPELTRLIKSKIASGRYSTPNEVIREALLRLAASELPRAQRLAELRRKIAEGLADSRAGRVTDGQAALKRIEARIRKSQRTRRGR